MSDPVYDEELGKAICDRLGLDPQSTARDYKIDETKDNVAVFMTVVKMMPRDEFNDLREIAAKRAYERNQKK